MSSINFHTKEISVKIVYYGPGLCGKTTSLQAIYRSLPEDKRNQFVSLATEVDRTIFFDFLPVTAYRIRDFAVRLQLYTVPGQVFYNATRKLVLNGVDGVVFVCDSQRAMHDSNAESLRNLEENLLDLGMQVEDVPIIIQANKRDIPGIFNLDEMDSLYNKRGVPFFGTVATTGEGVLDALKVISKQVVNNLVRKGLGKQLREQEPSDLASMRRNESEGSPLENVAAAAAAAGTAESLQDAVLPSNLPARTPTQPPGLWPTSLLDLGTKLEEAIRGQRWGSAVTASDAVIRFFAKTWAHGERVSTSDPLPLFLLAKGVSGARYETMRQALRAIEKGDNVTREEAMTCFILALEAAW